MLRMHWTKRSKQMDQWRRWVWAARCQAMVGKPVPPQRARVMIERRSPWLLDEDNLWSSAKFICDSLRANELIVDDSQKHIQLTVTQSKGKKQTTIRIEALE